MPRDPYGAATTPSAAPSLEPPTPSPTPDEVIPDTDVRWYLARVPKFDQAPSPVPVSIEDGQSTPWLSRLPTQHKVAFITIDDGGMIRTKMALDLIKMAKIPVSLFLNSPAAVADPAYFKAIQETGAHIQDHTVTHRSLKGQSYDFQKKEINDCANKLEEIFGARPYLFRPPFGDYDNVTLKAARDSGMRASMFWTQTVNDGIVRYQSSQKVVKPGDVFLMHFRPNLAMDLLGALDAMKQSGITPARLEDYLPRKAA